MSVRPGTRLDGRYRLSDRLAYGGMGEVWRATDEVLSREVAVKILRPELAEDEAFVRRFRAEARTTSGLPHNGIAAVYDYGETRVGADGQSPAPTDDDEADPVAYLVMELVPGEALSAILSRDGALGSDLTLDYVAQAARALHAAHQRGVIHRDIKPANLMVTPDGRVKVTDFGIARPLDHEPLTATGQVMGTAHYLAPELAKGQDASALSDVYALGVVAYECLAGHRPFEGDNQVAVALAHLNEQPPSLPGTIPDYVRAVVGAAMDKDPQRRMPSAEAFAAALEVLRFRNNGDDQLSTGAGVLPGSAAAAGLAAAGLLGPQNRGWTPGLPSGRDNGAAGAMAPAPVPATPPPPPGTHLLGPAPSPRGGGTPNGFPDLGDPFRTPTAPGGLSITPAVRLRERNRSSTGPVLALAALAVAVVIAVVALWMSGLFGGASTQVPGGDPPVTPTQSETSAPGIPPPVVTSSSTSSSTSSTRPRRTPTATSSRTLTTTSAPPSRTTTPPGPTSTTDDPEPPTSSASSSPSDPTASGSTSAQTSATDSTSTATSPPSG